MYVVDIDPQVRDTLAALPDAALAGFAEALAVMELVPWSGESLNADNPDGEVRQLVFGPESKGFVVYLILERDRRVDVVQVTWVG